MEAPCLSLKLPGSLAVPDFHNLPLGSFSRELSSTRDCHFATTAQHKTCCIRNNTYLRTMRSLNNLADASDLPCSADRKRKACHELPKLHCTGHFRGWYLICSRFPCTAAQLAKANKPIHMVHHSGAATVAIRCCQVCHVSVFLTSPYTVILSKRRNLSSLCLGHQNPCQKNEPPAPERSLQDVVGRHLHAIGVVCEATCPCKHFLVLSATGGHVCKNS